MYSGQNRKVRPSIIINDVREMCKQQLGNAPFGNTSSVGASANMPVVLFLVGGPGSGKGTQCSRISRRYGLKHLGSGELLRAEVSAGTVLGRRVKPTMDAGELVDLRTVLELLKAAMKEAKAEAGHDAKANNRTRHFLHSLENLGVYKRFLIDGYPRTVEQAEVFEREVQSPTLVLFFDAPETTLTTRLLSRGRSDDNEAAIRQRIRSFNAQTMPVIRHYEEAAATKTHQLLRRFDTSKTADEVFKEISHELDHLLCSQ